MFHNQLDDEDVFDWPADSKNSMQVFRKLDILQENLQCPICQSLFDNPQVLKCGHSYCSICIRKHFDKILNRTNPDVCPSCREKADSADLVVNRTLALSVSAYREVRTDLRVLLCLATSEDFSIPSNNNKRDSQYVDREKSLTGTIISKRIPHYNFHGYTKEKVKKTIDEYMKFSKTKLRTDGDKDVLERRFREFVHLSNAQVDSLDAMTFEEVVRQVNSRETVREVEAKKFAKTFNKLEKLKNGEDVKDINDGFSELIRKAREQKQKKLNELTEPTQDTSEDNNNNNNNNNFKDSLLPETQWGPWRIVFSDKLGKPFFFNSLTNIGQFDTPKELLAVPPDDDDNSDNKETDDNDMAAVSNNDDNNNNNDDTGKDDVNIDNNNDNHNHHHNSSSIDFPSNSGCDDSNNNNYSNNNDNSPIKNKKNNNSNNNNSPVNNNNNSNNNNSPINSQIWECERCTFHNDYKSTSCVMCDHHNPNHANNLKTRGQKNKQVVPSTADSSVDKSKTKENKRRRNS